MKNNDLKLAVSKRYSEIASQTRHHNQTSCCGSGSCSGEPNITVFSDDYSNLSGYLPEADLGLGCGLPTEHAGIKPGDHVLDLGAGAGNDCFVARELVGETGWVTGLDFTDAMLDKARSNAARLSFKNVDFVKGDIEEMPLPDESFDVVISNCVLNLVPDKMLAFVNVFRVLKPGGHFCISDVVFEGQISDVLRNEMELYAGCISGAVTRAEYLKTISDSGFIEIEVVKTKQIIVPDEVLLKYADEAFLSDYNHHGKGLYSLTVVGRKPA